MRGSNESAGAGTGAGAKVELEVDETEVEAEVVDCVFRGWVRSTCTNSISRLRLLSLGASGDDSL